MRARALAWLADLDMSQWYLLQAGAGCARLAAHDGAQNFNSNSFNKFRKTVSTPEPRPRPRAGTECPSHSTQCLLQEGSRASLSSSRTSLPP
eukprot:3934169-Rhodomonas_salina.2